MAVLLQHLIHVIQHHIRQERAQRSTLRCALIPLQHYAITHDAAVQVRPYQPDDPGVVDAFLQAVDEDVVVDAIKEFLQIDIDYDLPASLDVALCRQYRVVGPPSGAEAVAVFAECRVKHRLQHLQQGLLDQPIRDRRDAKLALAAVRFRDRYPSYRTRPVRPPQQVFAYRRPRSDEVTCGLVNIQTIHARRPFVGFDSLPRLPQVLSRQYCLKQSRPCALGVPPRAGRFVAGRIAPGFTVRYACPLHLRRLLTHCVQHRHGLEHFSSFGPSPPTGSYYGLC
jgi:hypothetical protein